MTKKPKINSVSNNKNFLVLKISTSDMTLQTLQKLKEEIYQDDDFALTMMKKEKNKNYKESVNTYEMVKEDLLLIYFQDHILIIIAKTSDLFGKLKEKVLKFFK